MSADLQPKRINYRPGKSSGFSEPKAYSSSAVYEEVRILKALGLLVANPDPAKPHTYQLSEEIRNLPWYHRNAFFRSIFYSQEITRSLNRFTILEDEIARIRQQIEALLRRAQERAAEDIAEEAMLDSLERDFETRFVRNAAMLSKDYVSDEGTEIGLAERRFGRGVYELIEKTKSLSTMARIISIYERVGEEWFKQAGDQFVRAYKDNYAKAVYKLRQLEIDDLLSFIIFWDPSLQGKQEQIRNALEDDLEDSIALRNTLLNLGMAQEEITRHILPYMHRTAGVQRLLQVARFTTNSSLGAPGVEIRRNYNNFEAMESDLLNRQIQQENRIPQMYDWAMIGLLRAHIMDHFGVYIEIPFGSTQIQDGNDQLIEGYPGTEETASPEVLLKIYNSLKEIEKALLNVQANRKQLVGMNFNLRKFV
ncbi:MAG: hypothetical protein NTY47_07625, partial [Candidatus Omnitrophica bacterium]|nr:hypothetical protein [Candidatus Omnitrophota bacterium]